jgi:bacillopeptidase F
VSYSLEANDALGNLAVFPADGPFEFVIGVLKVLYFNDFEGATDEGWTHSGVNDDWQRGAPQGKDNDPGQAYSGSQCWGTALGQGNSTGLYATDSRSLLSSPSIDCSNASNIRMSFQRVLHSEKGTYDQAQVYGDSQLLWENDLGADHHDTGWQSIDMDISAVADNNPSLNISFLLESDWSIEYAGWNIDDLLVYCLAPLPGNADQIQLTGTTQGTAGQSASWSLSLAPANAPYWLLYSMSNTGTSISGHAFDIGSPWFIADNGTTNTLGEATVNATLPPNSVGLTVYLEAAANLGGISDSNILTLQIQ